MATNSSAQRRTSSLRHRVIFWTVLTCLVAAFCELISWTGLVISDSQFSLRRLRQKQEEIASGASASDGASEAIHPYVGWVHNPQITPPEKFARREIRVNWLGFKDDSESVYRRSDDVFIVGIAGGSVAWQFSWEAENVLREKLAGHPSIRNRRIQFVRMALPGYKQPQQLMALNFLLSLGAEFDAVINIDGFNETVLTIDENVPMETSIVYPRSWHARSILMVDPRVSEESARLLYLRGKRQQLARAVLASSLHRSLTVNLIWYIRDELARSELTDLGTIVIRNRASSFVNHGPANRFSEDALNEEVASIWTRCSMQMHHLCRANEAIYLHVLQPNQYVANSKPMGAAELRKCYSVEGGMAEIIQGLYPVLLKQSQDLTRAGVEFSDQTMVFSKIEEPLYVDAWCHFNEAGNRLLGVAIADLLLEIIDRRGTPPVGPGQDRL